MPKLKPVLNTFQQKVLTSSKQAKLVFVLCTLLCASIWIFTLRWIDLARDRAIVDQLGRNAVLAQTQEGRISNGLQVFDQILLVLRDDFLKQGKPQSLNQRLNAIQVDRTYIGIISLISETGDVIATTADEVQANFADREYFKEHASDKTDRLLIGKPIVGRKTGKSIISLTRRLYHPNGSFAGVIFLALDPMFLAPNYSNVDLPQDVTITLVGLDGIVRVRQINGTNSSGEDVRAGQLLREVRNAEIGNFISFTPIDGRRRATSYRKLPNFPMVVLVGSPVDQVTDALMGNERAYLLSAFLGNLLVIALAIGIYTAFARGRQRFAQAAASAERMRAIIDASPVPMALNDPVGRITFLNRSFIETFGYGPEDIPTLDAWWRSAYPDLTYRAWVIDTWGEEIKRTQKTGTNFTPMEIKLQCKDGSEKFAIASAARYSPDQDAEHLAVLFDITQHKLAEQAIQSSLLDKEALLKEVHHRVKNNLQIISSLIRLEAGRSHQEELQSVLGDMQGRVRSMALLHETLYRGQSFAQIDLGEYLRQLALQVFSTNLSKRAPIELKLEVSSVSVTLDEAIPCGLLANELITNALKHGFPGGLSGSVSVKLSSVDGISIWSLSVSDSGVGLPDDFESKRQGSLGLQLATGLANQLGGELRVGPGAMFSVEFSIGKSDPAGMASQAAILT